MYVRVHVCVCVCVCVCMCVCVCVCDVFVCVYVCVTEGERESLNKEVRKKYCCSERPTAISEVPLSAIPVNLIENSEASGLGLIKTSNL